MARLRGAMVLGGVLVAVAVGWAIATLRVEEIRVAGAEEISANEVVEAARIAGDERILWMRTSVVARRLSDLPGVASASVERVLPTTLVLRVRERQPVAQLARHAGLVADGAGVVFAADPEGLPVLFGYDGSGLEPGATLGPGPRAVLAAFEVFPRSIHTGARSILAGTAVVVVLADGTEIRFGLPEQLEAKAAAADAVLSVNEGVDLAYIDVRTPDVPTSRRRDVPEPTATPSDAEGRSGPLTTPEA